MVIPGNPLRTGVGRVLAIAVGALAATLAHADYPDKQITFVVPFAAGSATDQLARALGAEATRIVKQPVVVDNKPGASGFIGAEVVKKAAPDGYTVFITTNTTHAANEHLFKKIPYDPVKDYAPVTALGKGGQIMIVNLNTPAKTVAEFIALAKAQPGKISFGSGSSSSRVAGEMLQQLAGIELLHVPYKSNPLAVNDLLGGQINMMITDMATGLPQVQAGKVRALAVSTTKRSPLVPDLPTIAEAGVKGYDMGFWFAAYVPAGTPAPVVARLHELLAKANHSQTVSAYYAQNGFEALSGTPEELRKFQAGESEKWRKVIHAAGIEKE
jgi:tripartite-type tricarboxylate transporter receptor subunit TctC